MAGRMRALALAALVLSAAVPFLPAPSGAVHGCGAEGAPAREVVEASTMVGDDAVHRFIDDTPTAVTYRFVKPVGAPGLDHLTLYVTVEDAQGSCGTYVCNDVGGWLMAQCAMPRGEHLLTIARSADTPAAVYVLTAVCGPVATPC